MSGHSGIRVALALAIVAFSLFEFLLQRQSCVISEYVSVFLSLQWILLVCLAVWCGVFLFLTFSLNDLPLIGLLLIAITTYFVGIAARSATDAYVLLAGVTLGKGARLLLKGESTFVPLWRDKSAIENFLVGLVGLLAFSSWWHLHMSGNFYLGPRWMGLWDNPNDYGMLMGAGLTLAIGLLAGRQKEELIMKKMVSLILFISAGMTMVGLLFSYSRGAWLGTAVGLLYLATAYGKFKWRWVLLGTLVVASAVCFFWHSTADTDQWYVKRLDLSRASAQHRVAAWYGAVQMMRDHPMGVGWNNAVGVYEKNYSPPEGGAVAIVTNDYLMLGTQLGLPGLFCFVGIIWNGFRKRADNGIQMACRAGALALLVAFWFDGGLFELATASVFWILLELGTSHFGDKQNPLIRP
jgi:hypothetical protein